MRRKGRTLCPRRLAALLAVVALPACPAMIAVAAAGPGEAPVGSIGRANLDGSAVDRNFIGQTRGPSGVAVDAARVYWSNSLSDAIGRATLAGRSVQQRAVAGADGPAGVAVDGAHLYWANSSRGTIGRANLDGSSPQQSFITGAEDPVGVAVDAGHVYWADSSADSIGRANLDGSSPEQGFITGAADPVGVAVDAGHVYWSNLVGHSIGRANLDGSLAEQRFIADVDAPVGIAVDAGHVYWSSLARSSIGRANLDGSGLEQQYIADAGDPVAVAVDAGHVYWANLPLPLSAPSFGKTVNLRVVSGTIRIRKPGSKVFAVLGAASQVPIGSIVDARAGRLEIIAAANPRGVLQVGEFYEGGFAIRQIRGPRPLIELVLRGGRPRGCARSTRPAARAASTYARSAAKRSKKPHLWGDAKGNWRTRGKGGATTVRGTIWLVEERCGGTLTRVRRGVVRVSDFARRRTVTVRAGKSYLARYRR